MTRSRHHSIFSNLEIWEAARPNHAPFSGWSMSPWKPLHVQHGPNRGQSCACTHIHTRSMAGLQRGHRGHPALQHPDELPCLLQLLPPGDLTGAGHLLYLPLHWQRRHTKSSSEVTEQLFSEMKALQSGVAGETAQHRSIPDHRASNLYFDFSSLVSGWITECFKLWVKFHYQEISSNKKKNENSPSLLLIKQSE